MDEREGGGGVVRDGGEASEEEQAREYGHDDEWATSNAPPFEARRPLPVPYC
jgi:hypothetical protein